MKKHRTSELKKRIHEESEKYKPWKHSGGKLYHEGAETLSDSELLSILISTGIKGKSAEKIAEEIIGRFGSFKGLALQPFEKLEAIRGVGKVKTIRIAAAFEIARRIVHQIKREK